jgi:O-methyltransferase
MASWWDNVELSECYFYHRVRLRDGRYIDGPWNLIDGEEEYLGGVQVEGRRVLEFGPASGWLTAWLELQGASVVGFDAGWDLCLDVLPLAHLDREELQRQTVDFLCRVQNAWWYLHRDLGLFAQVVYGPIYDLPDDIGRYDISVFAAILTHLRDPFRALEQAAQRTDEAIVVVEPLVVDLGGVGSITRWNPCGSTNPAVWWFHTPAAIVDMLSMLGFSKATVTYHQQPYKIENTDGPRQDSPFFTVVGRRDQGST